MNLVERSSDKLRRRGNENWEEVVWVCGEARSVLRADLVLRSCGKLRRRRNEDWEEVVLVCGEARAVLRADLVGRSCGKLRRRRRIGRMLFGCAVRRELY
jgi:hypothetical protein